jgi:hypothetical protein
VYTLITAANSAEAYKLKNKLNLKDVILGDYLELPAFMLASGNIIKLPNPDSIAYAHEMLTLCLDKSIDTIYPLRDNELTLLIQAELLFNEYGIKVMKQTNKQMNQ